MPLPGPLPSGHAFQQLNQARARARATALKEFLLEPQPKLCHILRAAAYPSCLASASFLAVAVPVEAQSSTKALPRAAGMTRFCHGSSTGTLSSCRTISTNSRLSCPPSCMPAVLSCGKMPDPDAVLEGHDISHVRGGSTGRLWQRDSSCHPVQLGHFARDY